MKNGLGILACWVLFLPSPCAGADSYQDALQSWSRVLTQFVDNEGKIDFTGLRNNRADLDRYAAFVKETGPGNRPELFPTAAEILTYHINTYNALAMRGVIEKNITDGFNSFFKRARFFRFYQIIIGGKATSLHDYENSVIRPLGEPRVHFALNCMVKDCPRLPREPFAADKLEEQLESAAREFFAKERHLRADHEKNILWLSEILDFYTRDFVSTGKRNGLISYVNKYLVHKVPEDYQVRFIPYDWTLNISTTN